jgi:hypothetical protein
MAGHNTPYCTTGDDVRHQAGVATMGMEKIILVKITTAVTVEVID